MSSFGSPLVTYGQLSQILAQLRFTRTDTAEYTAFRNAAHDALLALPVVSPQQMVDAAHMAAVQATITGSGVASEKTLACLLMQYATENSATEAKPQHSEAA